MFQNVDIQYFAPKSAIEPIKALAQNMLLPFFKPKIGLFGARAICTIDTAHLTSILIESKFQLLKSCVKISATSDTVFGRNHVNKTVRTCATTNGPEGSRTI